MSIKKAVIFLAIIAVAGSSAMYFLVKKNNNTVYSTTKVARGNINQTVSETGTVKAANVVDLSFYNSGRISEVHVKIGDAVQKGQVLAELDYSSLLIKENEVKASLDSARHSLEKLLAGASDEELAVIEAEVSKAKSSYAAYKVELEKKEKTVNESVSQAEKRLVDLKSDSIDDVTPERHAVTSALANLENTKTTYQNSVNNQIENSLAAVENRLSVGRTALDKIEQIITDKDAKDLISASQPEYLQKTNLAYNSGKQLHETALSLLGKARTDKTNQNVVDSLDSALACLNKIFEALNNCFKALEYSVTSSSFTNTQLNAFKTEISSQETIVSTAISSVQTSKHNLEGAVLAYNTNVSTADNAYKKATTDYDNAIKTAENAISTAKISAEQQISAAEANIKSALDSWQISEAKMKEIKAPPNKHDVSLAEARIRQAQASMDEVLKQIDNYKIVTPLDGIVTRVKYEKGEQAPQGAHMISVLADNEFEIEILVSESDITKLKTGNAAEITLDSFSDEIKFYGNVSFVEPAETIIQDVIYYKVKVSFDPEDKQVKSGMTANAKILTASKENVLLVPSRSVIERMGQERAVRVLSGQTPALKTVQTGLRGDEGMTEIVSGLKEGDLIIEYINEK